ncbi:MAG TPA: CDP-alcohol phosphatidyltransferase family protein [Lacunisphaera sp.]|nr:CDP-alcohol phosphatidyltransferase family protein [Lacunisphaera sp.]
MIRHLPNLVTLVRLVVTPPLLVAAMLAESRGWFLGWLCLAWSTDALDGFLARRLGMVTDLGRLLDSWADYVTTALCVTGLAWLWPEIMAREWAWFAAGLVSFFAIVLYGVARYGRPPGYHTWSAKAVAVLLPVALAFLLTGYSSWPLHGVVVLQILGTLEEVVICHLLPGYSGEMATAWHAWRRRESTPPANRSELPAQSQPARSSPCPAPTSSSSSS